MAPALVHDLGGYLREQRKAAQLSLRQLSELAGISNPYLSQIERGLKKPSAEILQQIARGLQVSAESLYVKAGILDAHPGIGDPPDVLAAIAADSRLNDRQRQALVDVYRSFVESEAAATQAAPAGVAGAAADVRADSGPDIGSDIGLGVGPDLGAGVGASSGDAATGTRTTTRARSTDRARTTTRSTSTTSTPQ